MVGLKTTTLPKNPFPFEPVLKECFLAGGAILSIATNQPINDYDIFPKNRTAFEDIVTSLSEVGFIVNISSKAVTFKMNDTGLHDDKRGIVQVISYKYFADVHEIFNDFDFSICMGAYDFDEKDYSFHPSFYVDIAKRNLVFNTETRNTLNSFLRLNKYQKRGYNLSKSEMIKMCMTLMEGNMPRTWDELSESIGGIYGKALKFTVPDDTPFTFDNVCDKLSEIDLDNSVYYTEDTDLSKIDIPFFLDFMLPDIESEPTPYLTFKKKYGGVPLFFGVKDKKLMEYKVSKEVFEKYKPAYEPYTGEFIASISKTLLKETIKRIGGTDLTPGVYDSMLNLSSIASADNKLSGLQNVKIHTDNLVVDPDSTLSAKRFTLL